MLVVIVGFRHGVVLLQATRYLSTNLGHPRAEFIDVCGQLLVGEVVYRLGRGLP